MSDDRRFTGQTSRRPWCGLACGLAALALGGCRSGESTAPAPQPPEVIVAEPLVRDDTPYLTFTGRTEAMESVDVKARVSGYLEKVAFADGALVKEGDLLFQIDQRPYLAELSQAEAAVAEAKASLAKAEADLARAKPLMERGAVSKEEFDLRVAQQASSTAELQAAEASVDAAKLNLEFTEIRAPIAGRISDTRVTKGNLISENQAETLTTIVTVDPVYVYFDVDERALLTVRQTRAKEGQTIQAGNVADEKLPLQVGVVTDKGFSHTGYIDFVDNRVDSTTGTIRIRGVLSDPANPFVPGLFVRVRVPVGKEQPMMYVAERALGIDQGQRFVYVVGQDNKVEYKAVEAGAAQDGLRQITSDLPADARVIVEGLFRVRPGIVVTPTEAKMTDFAVAGGGSDR